MNPTEIAEALSALVATPYDATEFPFGFAEATGNNPATIAKLWDDKQTARFKSAIRINADGGDLAAKHRRSGDTLHCPLSEIGDEFGKKVYPREWFFVLPEHVSQAVQAIKDRTLHQLKYDPESQTIREKQKGGT